MSRYSFSCLLLVPAARVVAIFTSLQELITVLIESEEIAEAERQKFDMLWNVMPH